MSSDRHIQAQVRQWFSLPLLTKLKPNGPIQVLILAPTRELAMQVTNENE